MPRPPGPGVGYRSHVDTREQVVFLHGLGVGPDSWAAQLTDLPDGYTGFAPRIIGLSDDDEGDFTLSRAAAAVIGELDQRGVVRAHICGLSLGAMVAIYVAVEYPERVASLVLSGGQVHPPRAIMALQSAAMRVLPARVVAPDGTSKRRVLTVLAEVARVDFRPHLAGIGTPTLVLCGSRDFPNLLAAKALAAGIPNAQLHVIEGGGHEFNSDRPTQFSAAVAAFLGQTGPIENVPSWLVRA